MGKDPSHVTRYSDSSVRDEVCINCLASDEVPGGWGKLADPCPKPVGGGGLTYKEWEDGPEKERLQRVRQEMKELTQ